MTRRKKVYEGRGKMFYEGPEPGTLVQYFKDDTSADNDTKHAIVAGKGVLNNRISEHIMSRLNEIGIQTHFIRRLNMREQLVKKVEVIPLELVVRNVAAGGFATRLSIAEGTALPRSIIEYRYKGGDQRKQLVSEEHITAFGWAAPQDLDDMMSLALRTNDFLNGLFFGIGIRLIDFRLEFGRLYLEEDTLLIIADEISPDNCRLWDSATGEKLDKDRFRCDLGNLEQGYQEVARRLGILPESGGRGDHTGPKVVQ